MKDQQLLSRDECSALRGIAILAIVLHNYCHWLGFAVKENEYQFAETNNDALLRVLAHPDMYLPVHLFSYFGHYGVPVFLFLSGFGLVLKYERGGSLPAAGFVRFHYLKLLRIMIAGFVAFTLYDTMTPGAHRWHWHEVIAQLLMYINLLPSPDKIIWPGPYWFFGLMLQLYIVYRLLLYRRHWGVAVGAMLACWLVQAVCAPEGEVLNRLRYNCIGGMLPFCAGLLTARARLTATLGRTGWAGIAAAAAALATVLCFAYQSWFWVPLLIIAAAVGTVKAIPAAMLKPLIWTGGISAAMFVSHPIARKIFIPISRRGDVYDGLALYILAAIALAWLFQLITDKIPHPKQR